MDLTNYSSAFCLTLLVGLSTGIGSVLALVTKKTNQSFLSFSLGFSGGVMIYVSMIELFSTSQEMLVVSLGARKGSWITVISFFCGISLIAFIDHLVPSRENPHETRIVEEMDPEHVHPHVHDPLIRVGLMSALAIFLHNFPEGLATFTAGLKAPSLGLPIAVAVAIHNIPEGIAVSVPIYLATGNKKKAFIWSLMSGLSEPLGALVGYLILSPFLNDTILGILFAAVAGIMVFISLDELLPTSREYGKPHLSMYGLVIGMMVMAISLLLLP